MKNRLDSLEKKINIKFKDEKLALKALTHKSYLNEHPNLKRNDNERLEFLGDDILEFITTDFLYKKYKSYPEGKLTALRSSLVNTRSLTKLAQKINLEQYIFLSKGEKAGKTRSTILANVVESLIGAIYLDQGMKATKKFVTEFVTPKINIIL